MEVAMPCSPARGVPAGPPPPDTRAVTGSWHCECGRCPAATASPVYNPLIICDTCGFSMHDTPGNRTAHGERCHSSAYPANYSYPTAEAVLAAGWAPEDFTRWPYLSREDAFWQEQYRLAELDRSQSWPT